MKNRLLIVISAILIFVSGCSKDENPVARYDNYVISGKVVGGLFNTGAPGIKVMRGNDIVYTDATGNFIFGETSQNPYKDVYVTDSVNKTGSIFRNVSANYCYLAHTVGDLNINNIPQAAISVTLSGGMGNSNKLKVFFTDNFNINGMGNDGYCVVYLPEGKTAGGKVCVLLYTENNGQIVSYDRFGFKDYVEVAPGANLNFIFTDSMLTYNPPEVRVSGTITNIPPHSSSYPSFHMISLSPRNANYFYFNCLMSEINGNSFDLLIPGSLPVNYFPLLKLNYSDSSSMQIFTSNVNYILPASGGNNIVITNPDPPQIISPAPTSGIDSNTVFTLYTNYSDRIFHISVLSGMLQYHIYTKDNTFSLSDLYKLGLGGLVKNTEVTIRVNALGKYSNVNDFVYAYYPNVSGFISQPVQQTFFVKP